MFNSNIYCAFFLLFENELLILLSYVIVVRTNIKLPQLFEVFITLPPPLPQPQIYVSVIRGK